MSFNVTSMTVSDNTIALVVLGRLFNILGRISSKAGKKISKNVMENPGGALRIEAKTGTLAISKNSKVGLSTTPNFLIFYHTGRGF